MPDNEILSEGLNRELAVMEILLSGKGARMAITLEEYIQSRTLMGASLDIIKQDLLTDLTEGGRIFGEFRRSISATAAGSVERTRDVGEISELGIFEKYRWAAVLVNTCPDCMARHGQVKTWDEWEAFGLPRTGQTVCREHCKCMLLPEETTELEPIQRKK